VATNGLSGLLPALRARGLVAEETPGLEARLATGRTIAGYVGFDPSFPSLHAGNLVPVMGLLRLQQAGGRPVRLADPQTGQEYVILRAEVYEHLTRLLDDGLDMKQVAALVANAMREEDEGDPLLEKYQA
jgi:hypothetical protein